jgi:ribonuclease Y
MARDLKLDVVLARRSALIHDIGKVLYEETERVGSHAVSGAAFARAHGETDVIVHPVAAHHNDEAPATALAHLVAAADALSGARPGARRETEEAFGSRVEDFERICADYQEIDAAFVIQGGREVRVVVDPRRLDDLGAVELSMEIAGRIESEVTYPGQVKVTVMREIRASAVARRR